MSRLLPHLYLENRPGVVAMPCSLVLDRLEEARDVDGDCHGDGGQEVLGQDLAYEEIERGVNGQKTRMLPALPSARYGVPCWPCSTKSDAWRGQREGYCYWIFCRPDSDEGTKC